MKKFFVTMIVIIIVLAGLVYLTSPKARMQTWLVMPNGLSLQIQSGEQWQPNPSPLQDKYTPKFDPAEIPRDTECQRKCG